MIILFLEVLGLVAFGKYVVWMILNLNINLRGENYMSKNHKFPSQKILTGKAMKLEYAQKYFEYYALF